VANGSVEELDRVILVKRRRYIVKSRQLHCDSRIGTHHPEQHLGIRSGPVACDAKGPRSDGSQDIFNNKQGLALFNKLSAIFQTRDRRNGYAG
jgi:hypothetical protein